MRTLERLPTWYELEQVAKLHALDDEDRDVLILYKPRRCWRGAEGLGRREEAAANRGQAE